MKKKERGTTWPLGSWSIQTRATERPLCFLLHVALWPLCHLSFFCEKGKGSVFCMVGLLRGRPAKARQGKQKKKKERKQHWQDVHSPPTASARELLSFLFKKKRSRRRWVCREPRAHPTGAPREHTTATSWHGLARRLRGWCRLGFRHRRMPRRRGPSWRVPF